MPLEMDKNRFIFHLKSDSTIWTKNLNLLKIALPHLKTAWKPFMNPKENSKFATFARFHHSVWYQLYFTVLILMYSRNKWWLLRAPLFNFTKARVKCTKLYTLRLQSQLHRVACKCPSSGQTIYNTVAPCRFCLTALCKHWLLWPLRSGMATSGMVVSLNLGEWVNPWIPLQIRSDM